VAPCLERGKDRIEAQVLEEVVHETQRAYGKGYIVVWRK
jgi:hypothetical protein